MKFIITHKDFVGNTYATGATALLEKLNNDKRIDPGTAVTKIYDKNQKAKLKVLADIKPSDWGPSVSRTPGTQLLLFENEGDRDDPRVSESSRPIITVKKPYVKEMSVRIKKSEEEEEEEEEEKKKEEKKSKITASSFLAGTNVPAAKPKAGKAQPKPGKGSPETRKKRK